jgi:hypothetical protein
MFESTPLSCSVYLGIYLLLGGGPMEAGPLYSHVIAATAALCLPSRRVQPVTLLLCVPGVSCATQLSSRHLSGGMPCARQLRQRQ